MLVQLTHIAVESDVFLRGLANIRDFLENMPHTEDHVTRLRP